MNNTVFAKSRKGLWIKSVDDRIENVIRVYWQTRHVLKNKSVYEIGIDGTPNGVLSAQSSMMDRTWVECGVISLDQPCLMQFTKDPSMIVGIKSGAMRHVTDMIALGWGDTPEEVVDWFADLSSLNWLQVDQSYVAVRGKYEGFDRMEIVSKDKDEAVIAVYAGTQRFEFESNKCWSDLLFGCEPLDK